MKQLFFISLVIFFWFGCVPKEEMISFKENLPLLFSSDTVTFDTLLSEKRSSTKKLTVYNPNEEAIQIAEIVLGKGGNSDYKIIINGRETNSLANKHLFGGDSLLILVEVYVQAQNKNLPYLVKDSIIVRWNTNEEHIKLVAYGQDGHLINNQLICDERWTKERPYIISDTVLVSPACELLIEAGTKIYFENDATLFVQGSLKVLGNSENHVTFRNARFDGIYDQVPGQWNGIYFLEGSKGNIIQFTEIFNGQVGLRIGTPDDDAIPDVSISNTTIYNMSLAGLLAFTSDVEAHNLLIYNCGQYLVGGIAGGNYSYTHCTFSNDPPLFIQDEPKVQFSDNILLNENELLSEALSLRLVNTIIWGASDEELLINNGGEAAINVILMANIIKTEKKIPNNFTSREANFPGFKEISSNMYQLDTLAFAKDKGLSVGIGIDIEGEPRDDLPDIGAFERIEKKE